MKPFKAPSVARILIGSRAHYLAGIVATIRIFQADLDHSDKAWWYLECIALALERGVLPSIFN